METNQKLPCKPWKPTKNHEKPWNYLEKTWKPTKNQKGGPTDLHWSKNVTSLTQGPNWPPWSKNVTSLTRGPNWPLLIQKRDITDAGPQLTSFDPKMWRHWRGVPTDLLWSKNVTSLTGGPNWPPWSKNVTSRPARPRLDSRARIQFCGVETTKLTWKSMETN